MRQRTMEWESVLRKPPRLSHISRVIKRPGRSRAYHLPDLWSLNLYSFDAEIELNGKPLAIRPGSVCVMPPGTRRRFSFPKPSRHRCTHFRLAQKRGGEALLLDAGKRYFEMERLFDDALRFCAQTRARSEALLWQILWLISDLAPGEKQQGANPTLLSAVERIEQGSGGELRVAEIAHEVGISQIHLARLFKQAFGSTVVAYIRKRRMEIAARLLRETDLPVKAVAVEVGIPDPHHFNKTFRRELGRPPSALRN